MTTVKYYVVLILGLILIFLAPSAEAIRSPDELPKPLEQLTTPTELIAVKPHPLAERPKLVDDHTEKNSLSQAGMGGETQAQRDEQTSGAANLTSRTRSDYVNKQSGSDVVQMKQAAGQSLQGTRDNSFDQKTGGLRSNQGKALTFGNKGYLRGSLVVNQRSSLANSTLVGHTKRREAHDQDKPQPNKPLTMADKVEQGDNEQQSLDQGLIEAQIDDVLSSAEFLALEASPEFSQDRTEEDEANILEAALGSDPEQLLNQLDASDLMDYVAEDDLWKEQLTIEDEPF